MKCVFKLRFGDGKNCLPDGIPQRVNGVVCGTINSVSVIEQSLHCYVVTADGRTYTAISRYVVTYLIILNNTERTIHKRIFHDIT